MLQSRYGRLLSYAVPRLSYPDTSEQVVEILLWLRTLLKVVWGIWLVAQHIVLDVDDSAVRVHDPELEHGVHSSRHVVAVMTSWVMFIVTVFWCILSITSTTGTSKKRSGPLASPCTPSAATYRNAPPPLRPPSTRKGRPPLTDLPC
jgi:hypothetical protein